MNLPIWIYKRKNFEGSKGYIEDFLFGLIHIHWKMNPDISTMFIRLPFFFQYLVLGGWAGNGFSAIHIQWHKSRLITITIRTGCAAIWRKKVWRTPYESEIYIRLGQLTFKNYPESKEQVPTWRIEGYSQHFILLAEWLSKRFPWLASYEQHDEHDSGHYLATGRILWIEHMEMF